MNKVNYVGMTCTTLRLHLTSYMQQRSMKENMRWYHNIFLNRQHTTANTVVKYYKYQTHLYLKEFVYIHEAKAIINNQTTGQDRTRKRLLTGCKTPINQTSPSTLPREHTWPRTSLTSLRSDHSQARSTLLTIPRYSQRSHSTPKINMDTYLPTVSHQSHFITSWLLVQLCMSTVLTFYFFFNSV